MADPHSLSRRHALRLPSWGTFWGSQVRESSVPPVLATTVVVLTLGSLVDVLVGGPLSDAAPAWRSFLHVVLP
ncbi:MAG TPA: hypothetical protein VF017_13625, partial [Thermoanaerobaculia bacterium]|nr:hypothetical protein [Thermoanaerobaculia bacterium]